MCGQIKGFVCFQAPLFLKVPCVIYQKLPFLSYKPCFQVSTAFNFETVLKQDLQKAMTGECVLSWDKLCVPGGPNLFFFHPYLIWCCPLDSQQAIEWS